MPVYVGLNIHTQTRNKVLVEQLSELGMSISYDRVLQLENSLALSVCRQFDSEQLMCSFNLEKGLFTVAALIR